MIKIFVNVNKQDITLSYSAESLPEINGKIVKVEINGNDLIKLNIPISSIDSAYCIWHGRNAGRILNILRNRNDKIG